MFPKFIWGYEFPIHMDMGILEKIWVIFLPPLKSFKTVSQPCELEGMVPFHCLLTTACVKSALPSISASQKELINSSDHMQHLQSNAKSRQHRAMCWTTDLIKLTFEGGSNFRSSLRWRCQPFKVW